MCHVAVPTPTKEQFDVEPVSSSDVTVHWSPVVSKAVCGPVTYLLRLLDADNNDTLVRQQMVNVTVEGKTSCRCTGL